MMKILCNLQWVIFHFTTPSTDLQSLLVFTILLRCYVSDAGRTDCLTPQNLTFKVPSRLSARNSITSLHLSLSLVDRWGTKDDWATTFLHSSLCSAFRRASPNFKPVHSVTLSSHLFFRLPFLLPLCTVPCRITMAGMPCQKKRRKKKGKADLTTVLHIRELPHLHMKLAVWFSFPTTNNKNPMIPS